MPLGFPNFRSISDDAQVKMVFKLRQEKERQRASFLQTETASITSDKTLCQSDEQKRSTSVLSSIKTGEGSCVLLERVDRLIYASNAAYCPKTRALSSSRLWKSIVARYYCQHHPYSHPAMRPLNQARGKTHGDLFNKKSRTADGKKWEEMERRDKVHK